MKRRTFLQTAVAGLAGLPRLRGADLVPHVVGANTAITGYSFFRSMSVLREIGFQTIEVQNLVGELGPVPGRFPGFRFDRVSEAEKRKIKEAVAGVPYLTTHLPYTGLEYMAPSGKEGEDAIATLKMTMKATEFLGAKLAVIHPKPGPGMSMEESWPILLKRFREWGGMAQDMGFKLAVETMWPKSVKDFARLIHEINHENVGAIIDVGHQSEYAELVARVKPEERGTEKGRQAYNDINMMLVDQLGDKLIHFHVHDIEPPTWKEHRPLIYGFVDYPRLISKLKKTGYQGTLVFEIGGPASRMPDWLREGKRKLEDFIAAAS